MFDENRQTAAPISSWAFAFLLVLSPSADEFDVNKAKEVCETKGKLVSKGPVQVDGYFRSKDIYDAFGFEGVAKELAEKRFRYLEIDQQYWTDPRTGKTHPSGSGAIKAIGDGKKYFRYYLAPIDSPACDGFKAAIKGHPYQKLPYLRQMGLPKHLCIASEKTDDLFSRYEMLVERTKLAFANRAYYWSSRSYINDRETGEIQAEITAVGFDPGPRGKGFTCPNVDQVKSLQEDILKATPNPLLPAPNQVIIVDDPAEFPIIRETEAVLIEEKESSKTLREAEFYSAIHPIAEEGGISFTQKYSSGKSGFSLVGYYLQIIEDGTTKKVLVMVGEKKFWDFQKLLVMNDKLIFVAHPRNWSPKKLDIWVLQYSRSGSPLRADHISFPQVSLQGEVRYLINDIQINADHYIVNILDLSKDQMWFKVVKEFFFRVLKSD